MANTEVAKQGNEFPHMLHMFKKQVALALPSHMNAERMSRIALTAFHQNPTLGKCDPVTVFAAVIQSAQTGLEIGVRGQAFLVPYFDTKKGKYIAQFIPGWMGLVDLVNRAGNASAWTGAVYEGDEFDYAFGDRPYIKHKPTADEDPGALQFVYAVGRVKGAEWPIIEVWPLPKVRRHRDKYNKVGKAHYSFNNEEMYARKVPLLQVLKYLPSSPELTRAVKMNDAAEMGTQNFKDIESALEGEFTADDEGGGVNVPGPTERQAQQTNGAAVAQGDTQVNGASEKPTLADGNGEIRAGNAAAAQGAAEGSVALDKDDPRGPGFVTAGGLNMIRSKAKNVGKSAGDICHHFDVNLLRDLTVEKGNEALTWLRTFSA